MVIDRAFRVISVELLNTMGILALVAIPAEAGLSPVLAHLALVHGAFNERLPLDAKVGWGASLRLGLVRESATAWQCWSSCSLTVNIGVDLLL